MKIKTIKIIAVVVIICLVAIGAGILGWIFTELVYPHEKISAFSDELVDMIEEVYGFTVPLSAEFINGGISPHSQDTFIWLAFCINIEDVSAEQAIYAQICDSLCIADNVYPYGIAHSQPIFRDDVNWIGENTYTHEMISTQRAYTSIYYYVNGNTVYLLLRGWRPVAF